MMERVNVASRLVGVAAALALLYALRAVLWPLALAFVLGILISAVTQRIHRLFPRAGVRALGVVTGLIVGGLVLGAMSIVVAGVSEILSEAANIHHRLTALIGEISFPGLGRLTPEALLNQIDSAALLGRLAGAVQAAAGGLSLTALYLVFIIASARSLEHRLRKIVAARESKTLVDVLKRSSEGVQVYTYIQTITGLMMAVAAFFIMLLVGLKNPLFWALTLFLFSYLPVIGVVLGALGPTAFALVQFPTFTPAIIIMVGIQAVAFVVGNLILPKMQADSQNIDPAASLLAIGVWTIIWGIPGAFLAIPLTLALMYSLAQYKSVEWIAILLSNDGDPLPPPPIDHDGGVQDRL